MEFYVKSIKFNYLIKNQFEIVDCTETKHGFE